ncbi:MAG: hypothetical protein H6828_03410 [Planctomycetes bacterium]|nr:hypothetical protein [Planctomycetota bacterium]
MSFLKNLNLARVIILGSIVGSGYLAWNGMELQGQLDELRPVFPTAISNVCREIEELSKLNTKLMGDVKGDKLLSQASPESYIRGCADHPSVQVGDVDMTSRSKPGTGGIVDKITTIRPFDRKRKFEHYTIAQFLYRLEADSRQVKVTNIRLDLLNGTKDLDKIPADEWTFDIEVTNRVKEGGSAGPNAATGG